MSGKVTGTGRTRLLRYHVNIPAGDDARLFERAPGGTRQLAVVRRSGQLRFTPSDAAGSNRAILALVERRGIPVVLLTIFRFHASPPTIGRAHAIRARRAGGSVVVTWVPARGAQSQVVDVIVGDGRAYEVHAGARTRKLRIRSVSHGDHLRVLVDGLRAHGARRGPAAGRSFRIR